jgi:hypothetical protein
MNIHEGARRMKLAGQWIILVPLTLMLIIDGIELMLAVIYRSTANMSAGFVFMIPYFLVIATPGATLWLAGWIVEGFAKNSD